MPDADAESVVRLSRGVRLREDRVRGRTVLLAPERAVALDDIAVAIVQAIDGERTLGEIAAQFAALYDAPEAQIRADVFAFAQDFRAKGWLELVE